jgi:hypothetical protein
MDDGGLEQVYQAVEYEVQGLSVESQALGTILFRFWTISD